MCRVRPTVQCGQLEHARIETQIWRLHYNQLRPYGIPGNLARKPMRFAIGLPPQGRRNRASNCWRNSGLGRPRVGGRPSIRITDTLIQLSPLRGKRMTRSSRRPRDI